MGYSSYNQNNNQSGENRDYYQEILVADSGLTVVKPNADKETIIRAIPEIGADGRPLPMLLRQITAKDGTLVNEWSNLVAERIVVAGGTTSQKYTGSCEPSDMPGLHDFECPWAALYPIWKGQSNKNALTPDELLLFTQATTKVGKAGSPMGQVQVQGLLQCLVLQKNGEVQNPVLQRAVVLLSKSALASLDTCLANAAKMGVDAFDFDKGFTISIKGVPKADPKSNKPQEFVVSLEKPMPIPAGAYWLPIQERIRRMTYDEHVKRMVTAYGSRIVSKIECFASAMQRLALPMPNAQAVAQVQPPVAVAPIAPAIVPPAPVVAPVAAIVPPVAAPAIVPPAPLAAIVPPAPLAAPVAAIVPPVAAPAIVAPAPAPVAAAPVAAPGAATVTQLQAMYQQELNKAPPTA